MGDNYSSIEPDQSIRASSRVKPIVVTKRKRKGVIGIKFWKDPITQAISVVGLLVAIGVLVSAYGKGDGDIEEAVTSTVSPVSYESPAPVETPVKSVVGGVDILASIVRVVAECKNGDSKSGTGTIFIDEFHVLTSNHVVSSIDDCIVRELFVETIDRIDSAPIRTHSAQIFATDDEADLAILKIAPLGRFDKVLTAVKVSVTNGIGDPIIAVGFPGIGGDSVTVTRGEISGYAKYQGIQWIKSSVAISGGNSGGGVFDLVGGLVGVPTMLGTVGVEAITDCRPDRDTNGDGEIDADDQCVSVGGFINSLSPVGRAVELAEASGLKEAP